MRQYHSIPSALLSTALLAPFLSSGCLFLTFRAKAVSEDTASYPLARGGRLEVITFNGRIRVERSDGPEVRLRRTTTCRARTDLEAEAGLDLIVPEVASEEGKLTVKVSDPRTGNHRFQVDFAAWVPEETSLVLRTSNGDVEIAGVRADIDARTSNGSVVAREGGRSSIQLQSSNGKIVADRLEGAIQARTSNGAIKVSGCRGKIDVSTSNGKVEIDAARGVAVEGIRAETSNGTVRCLLPEAFSGDVDARTSNGRVNCEFPVTVEAGEMRKNRLRGRIGAGGPPLRLNTSNGRIEIQRALSQAHTGAWRTPPAAISRAPRT